MDNEILIYIAFGIVLAILFMLFWLNNLENNRKFRKLHNVMQELIKENHLLKKEMKGFSQIPKGSDMSYGNIQAQIKVMVEDSVKSSVIPILNTLKEIEVGIDNFQLDNQNRLINLEERTKNISKISPSYNNEEERIIELFKSGRSVESIAKDLRISVGSVEIILRLHRLI